jgi:two-component system sensor histidine kinase/response regulator
LARLGGNAELYVALAQTYAGEAAQFMPALRAALARPDAQAAANILHTFKNAAGIIGATALQNCAADLEAALREAGAAVATDAALARLDALLDTSAAALARNVQSLSAPPPPAPAAPAAAQEAEPIADLLRELDGLLAARDTAARATMAVIHQAYGRDLEATLAPLAACVGRLDFTNAALECRKLLRASK